MAGAITMQGLIDASLDSDTLGAFANEDKLITSRLGAEYPSAPMASRLILEQGTIDAELKPTKAALDADTVLVDSDFALVYNDDAVDLNGYYQKQGGVWEYLPYNIQRQALNQIEQAKQAAIDAAATDAQTKANTVEQKLDSRAGHNTSSSFLSAYGANGRLALHLSDTSELLVGDVVTKNGSVDDRLATLDSRTDIVNSAASNAMLLKESDRIIASRDAEPLNTKTTITRALTEGVDQLNTPTMVRIAKNRYLLVSCNGGVGDFAPSDIVTYFITVQPDYSLVITPSTVIVPSGTDAEGTYAASANSILRVRTGVHAGRIYVHFLKRYGEVKDVLYYIYSDDNGLSWSEHVDMTPFIPLMADWRVVIVSPAKQIQLKSGRIILACWHGDTAYPESQAGLRSFIMYSDDGGVTYSIGATSSNIGANECAAAEFGADGQFMLITRNASNYKTSEVSYDGGLTLTELRQMDEVTTTKVQSGFLQARNEFDLSTEKLIISTPSTFGVRENLGLYTSYDNKNFDLFYQYETGAGQYSDLEMIDENHILTVYITNNRWNLDACVLNLKSIFLGA